MSAIGTLLVHVDAGPHNAARLLAARELAARHGADVTALYAVMSSFVEVPFALESAGPALDTLKALDDERLRLAREGVERIAATPGPRVHWAVSDALAPVSGFMEQALYADLLVLGQREPQAHVSGTPADFVESVVIGSGRPALVLPHVGVPDALGLNVLVAWKASASAAHALAGAMPLLQKAERVTVVEWAAQDADTATGRLDIRTHLARHGVKAEFRREAETPSTTGELMQSMAADLGADLVVMGCYGHSRAREWVLGGATRTMLASMTVPVLMAH
jgi:nucleotide-binding universal stress UspA family protein